MPRLGVLNMLIGFVVLFCAAAAGSFVSLTITEGVVQDPAVLDSWRLMMQRSAHGHTNLFGLLHIVFGVTLPYSRLGARAKQFQTIGLVLGTLAMGVVMVIRAEYPPESTAITSSEIVMGLMLTAALAAIGTHAYGLLLKFMRSE